ncbi:hypothetical protein B6K86_00415 [Lachnospiraceae bacterium]|nr:hypothetical protein B6K86_00415 [Lachnospiraceae bacterium]
MIRIRVLKNAQAVPVGLRSGGHAGYDQSGFDIICSAVSVLEQNLANSVHALTDARFTCEIDEKTGTFLFQLIDQNDEKAGLLLASCLLGLEAVQEAYGNDYLTITDQEV